MGATRRYRLTLAYLGSGFHGWQRQANAPSIQAEVEAALGRIFNGWTGTVHGSGRTDAGVHAAAQVAHADLPAAIPPEGLVKALNATLPTAVRIRAAAVVRDGFHARRDAKAKKYSFRLRWSDAPVPPPWQLQRCAVVRPVVDPGRIASALEMFRGRHDWAAFTVVDPEVATTARTIFSARCISLSHGLRLEFVGEGFLRYQVRRMVGALLQLGWGQHDAPWLSGLIRDGRHEPEVLTAPAGGLTLERVYYRRPARDARW